MPDYNLVVVCPGQGTAVSSTAIAGSEIKLDQALTALKVSGQLPSKATLNSEIGFYGVASPSFKSVFPYKDIPFVGESKFIVDPQFLSCLSVKQDQSTLLHEVGHLNEPIITSLDYGMGYIALVGLWVLASRASRTTQNMWRRAAETDRMLKRFYDVMTENSVIPPLTSLDRLKVAARSASRELTRSLPVLLGSATLWMAGGLGNVYLTRVNETYADLYAAQQMRSPNYLESALSTFEATKMWLSSPEQSSGSPKYAARVSATNYISSVIKIIYAGPFGAKIDTHQTVAQRNAVQEKNRRAIEAHKPLKTSLDVLLNYKL